VRHRSTSRSVGGARKWLSKACGFKVMFRYRLFSPAKLCESSIGFVHPAFTELSVRVFWRVPFGRIFLQVMEPALFARFCFLIAPCPGGCPAHPPPPPPFAGGGWGAFSPFPPGTRPPPQAEPQATDPNLASPSAIPMPAAGLPAAIVISSGEVEGIVGK